MTTNKVGRSTAERGGDPGPFIAEQEVLVVLFDDNEDSDERDSPTTTRSRRNERSQSHRGGRTRIQQRHTQLGRADLIRNPTKLIAFVPVAQQHQQTSELQAR
jgi:hypothetical protein